MSQMPRLVVIAFTVLLVYVTAYGQTPAEELSSLLRSADVALAAGRSFDAVRACAEALRRFTDDPAAHACAQKVAPGLDTVVNGAVARLGAGAPEDALQRCTAVLVLSPAHKDASACASAAQIRIAAHRRDTLKLEQARTFIAEGDHERAAQNVAELSKSEFPDVLNGSVALQDALTRSVPARIDLAGRAAIERARLLVAHGRPDDATKMLHDVLATSVSQPVREEALRALSNARPSLRRSFVEALRNPWMVQVLAVLTMLAALWIALHLARDLWRWADGRLRSVTGLGRRWKFAGLDGNDSFGARDVILDALRRVPHEVRKPLWTPTRLLLYPDHARWDVWEDFCIAEQDKANVIHEKILPLDVQPNSGDKILSDAFQNLEFTVGSTSAGRVTKFWAGLVEWWHTGEPSFSATCQELAPSDTVKQVVIRLSAAGPNGVASVLATTDRQVGSDAVSLSAERAAYKLLFTMTDHTDSAAQIDGHAAFRQGVTSLSRTVRAITDTKVQENERSADIFKAIHNLEVARRSFERDGYHRVYHLQSLRFLGVAYALVGREAAARTILEELEDVADKSPTQEANPPYSARERHRDHQLKVEAQLNQAMLYCGVVAQGGAESLASLAMADALMDSVKAEDPSLADAVQVWRLMHLNGMSWREWRSLGSAEIASIREEIEGSDRLPELLDERARNAVGADRRHNSLLAAHARRNLAIARLRCLAAFDLSPRLPFAKHGRPAPYDIHEKVRNAFALIGASGLLGPLPPTAALARAYGLLVLSQWFDAESAALEALETDASDQFAIYVAAEAAFQRGDSVAALKYFRDAQQTTVIDPDLQDFIDEFKALHAAHAGAMAAASSVADGQQNAGGALQLS
jgi:tetratricopeptide (TPR) repeat protein